MASFKASILFTVLLTTTAVLVSSSTIIKLSNSLIVGKREAGDQSVHNENIAEKASVIGKKVIVTMNITVPPNYYVTQVECWDQASDGTGAEATLTGGGPGASSVSLRFKSQRFHGVYVKVEVFAKRRY